MSLAPLFVFSKTVFIFCINLNNCVIRYDTILERYDFYLPDFETMTSSFRTIELPEAATHSLGSLKPQKLQNLIILSHAS